MVLLFVFLIEHFSLLINLFAGTTLGASVLISRRYGARDAQGVHKASHTSLMVGIIFGIIAMVVGLILSKPLLVLMGTPDGIILNGATLYLRIIFLGVPATMIYNFGASVMRGIGDTKRPFYILLVTGLVNVCLNLLFVIGFHMGVTGVAMATIIANYLSAAAVVYYLMNSDGDYRIDIKKLKLYKEETFEILKIGLPAGLQGTVFALSNTVIQSGVNSFGQAAIAGNAASGNIDAFIYQAMNAFYQATITCVSQNFGAKRQDRLKKSIYTPVICASIIGAILGLLVVVFARPLLGIYITDSESAIDFGQIRILISTLPYFLVGVMEGLCGAIRGLGHSNITFFNSVIGACGLRVVWVSFVLPLYRTPAMLYLCWPISWVVVIMLHTITLMLIWKKTMKKMMEA